MNKTNNKSKKNSNIFKRLFLAGAIGLSTLVGANYLHNSIGQRSLTSYEQLTSLQEVESIIDHKGQNPDVIVILQNHPSQEQYDEGIGISTECIENIQSLCYTLHDKFGVRSLIPEGLDPSIEIAYNEGKEITFDRHDSRGYFNKLEELINGRKWTLKSGEDPNNRDKIDAIRLPIRLACGEIIEQTKFSVGNINNKYFGKTDVEEEIKKVLEINAVLKKANTSISNRVDLLLTPQKMQDLYDVEVTERDKRYAAICRDLKQQQETPVIMIYGSGHVESFPKHLDGLNYVVICPKGVERIIQITPEGLKERYKPRIVLKD